jgi:hypothetical protein
MIKECKMQFWKNIVSRLAAGSLAIGLAMPAASAPLPLYRPILQPDAPVKTDVLRVDHKQGHNPHRNYQQRNGRYYYNGHRGYRNYRQGYRRYNGWWFPPAAFAFGFTVAPAPRYVAPPRYGRGLSPAHYQWCSYRYRSYRPYDNSFQPYHGPRRACFSPYGP